MVKDENYVEYIINTPLYLNSSLTLYLCGRERCFSGHSFGPAIRSHYLFHFILKGKGKYYVGDNCYTLVANQGFLIFPGESTLYVADDEEPWEYCWFGFDGYEVKSILEHCNLSKENPIYFDSSNGLLKNELLKLGELFNSCQFNEFEAMGHLYLVFSKMQQNKKPPAKTFQKNYSDKAVDFINHNYSYDIRVEDIAKNIGIDRTYLYKIFIEIHKASPQQYLIEFRLHKASTLLEATKITITEIAYSCGFKDTPSFYKHFKQKYGVTPKAYRALYNKL